MHPCRVFVAYAHEDQSLADKLHEWLTDHGLINMWDRSFPAATGITETIKQRIGCSHLFIPLITRAAMRRPWVHQETGFAVGAHVPVIPIAVRGVSQAMIRDLNAIEVGPNLKGLDARLTEARIESLLEKRPAPAFPRLLCADHPEARTELIVKYWREAHAMADDTKKADCCLRERAAFSTFSIPDAPLRAKVWSQRAGKIPLTEFHCSLLRQQRRELEADARRYGCRLIISPSLRPAGWTKDMVRTHLELVAEFLESLDDEQCVVAIAKPARRNLLLCGDWFLAESHTPQSGLGFQRTLFTWDAPYVLHRQRDFDKELKRRLNKLGWKKRASRRRALEVLADNIRKL